MATDPNTGKDIKQQVKENQEKGQLTESPQTSTTGVGTSQTTTVGSTSTTTPPTTTTPTVGQLPPQMTQGTSTNTASTVQQQIEQRTGYYQFAPERMEEPTKLEQIELDKDPLDQWLASATEQANNQIDHAVQQGVTEQQRAYEDALPQFQTQRDQVDINEAKALDNQALYAEARGDRGGIGQAQYNTIMNNAMVQRRTINQAQTKLSTDTARSIADLRANGEFAKADALLTLTQTYLKELQDLKQWTLTFNMSIEQFNQSVEQWWQGYMMDYQQLLLSLTDRNIAAGITPMNLNIQTWYGGGGGWSGGGGSSGGSSGGGGGFDDYAPKTETPESANLYNTLLTGIHEADGVKDDGATKLAYRAEAEKAYNENKINTTQYNKLDFEYQNEISGGKLKDSDHQDKTVTGGKTNVFSHY